MTYEITLLALADRSRRALFERLRKREYTVGELAQWAGVTQPAVSQHLRVLREARLVTPRSEGTRRFYRATPEGLLDLRRYVESMWDDVLTAFASADPAAGTVATRSRKKRV